MNEVLLEIFGGDSPTMPLLWYQIAARSALTYIIGVVVVRVGKSRLLGRVTPLDVIVGFMLGSILSRGIIGETALSSMVVSAFVLVFVHYVVTYIACRWPAFDDLFKGNSRVLIENGQIQFDQLRKSHFSKNDLLEELRVHGIEDSHQVKRAIKERNGQVSVLKV